MGRIFGIAPVIFLLASCLKTTQAPPSLSGTYLGVYMRTGNLRDTAGIEITFLDNSFNDKYNTLSHPDCHGFYRLSEDSIDFQNLCDSPNYKIILDGKFRIDKMGDSLSLSRDYRGIALYADHYNLIKQ
jgi:hypothetical protein